MRLKARPNDALDAMYQHDMALGIDPLEPSPVIVVGQPPAEVPTFRIDPPPWSENYIAEDDPAPDFIEDPAEFTGTGTCIDEPTPEARYLATEAVAAEREIQRAQTSEPEEPNPRGRKARKALRRSIRQAWAR